MNKGSIGTKPNFKLSYSDASVLKENADNDSKIQNENQNGLNQQNLRNLQQNIEDIQARINMLKKQKESEEKQHLINIKYKDNEIQIYKEMIDEAQQQYNDCQEKNDQTIKQLNSQITNTQNDTKLTEQEMQSINNQIWEYQMKPREKIIKIPLLFDYKFYKGHAIKLDEQRYHHDCNKQDNTISIGDDGKVFCDAGCGVLNCNVLFLDFNEKKLITSYQENQSKRFQFNVIFQEILNQSLYKYDRETKIRFRKTNI